MAKGEIINMKFSLVFSFLIIAADVNWLLFYYNSLIHAISDYKARLPEVSQLIHRLTLRIRINGEISPHRRIYEYQSLIPATKAEYFTCARMTHHLYM